MIKLDRRKFIFSLCCIFSIVFSITFLVVYTGRSAVVYGYGYINQVKVEEVKLEPPIANDLLAIELQEPCKVNTVINTTEVFTSQVDMVELGEYDISGYCACNKCFSQYPKVGKMLMSGREDIVVLTNPKSIPFGSKIWIEGVGVRQTQQHGFDLDENQILVYFSSLDKAESFAKENVKVYKILE